jgi:hypothetical protein
MRWRQLMYAWKSKSWKTKFLWRNSRIGNFKSDISGKEFPENLKVNAGQIKSEILQKIREANPGFDETCCLSVSELNEYRNRYIQPRLCNADGTVSIA